jgi:hypothetical protein
MEFSNINLTKQLESFAPCYSQSFLLTNFKENHTTALVLIPSKNIRETRKLKSIYDEHVVESKNKGRKPDKDSSFCLETSTKNAIQEFHL